jgi:hypothetical protein
LPGFEKFGVRNCWTLEIEEAEQDFPLFSRNVSMKKDVTTKTRQTRTRKKDAAETESKKDCKSTDKSKSKSARGVDSI